MESGDIWKFEVSENRNIWKRVSKTETFENDDVAHLSISHWIINFTIADSKQSLWCDMALVFGLMIFQKRQKKQVENDE